MATLNKVKILPPSLAIPKTVKIIAKTIQFISPKLAVAFASKLFTTPITFPTPEREEKMRESAQEKTIHVPAIGKKISVLSYGYSKKKVLLVHGWCGRSTQLFMPADKLLERGYMVISFDAPAHGKSEGKTTLLDEFVASIHEIDKQLGPFESAIGHSLGGMSLYNVVADGFSLKSMVTIGAGDTITEVMGDFVKNLSLKPKIAQKLKAKYDKKWQYDIDEHSSHEQAKKIKIPVLVVHDTSDGDVAVSCAENIRQNLENGSLLLTQGLGHTKILRDKETMSRVVNFIIDNT